MRAHLEKMEHELATHFVIHAYADADRLRRSLPFVEVLTRGEERKQLFA